MFLLPVLASASPADGAARLSLIRLMVNYDQVKTYWQLTKEGRAIGCRAMGRHSLPKSVRRKSQSLHWSR